MQSVSEPDHEFSISCDRVSVTYRTSVEKKPTLKTAVRRLGRRERVVREVRALKDVNFRVKRGAVYGVVGTNGAGKSTLMRTITGILPPTEGRVEVRGRVSTLLALGVGFNKELTGRENVVLGGMAAGIPREAMEDKYEEIVRFAELEDFMDMPMRTYSSGMYARLGFSVAVHMEPDILVIDEALSVGDAKFRKKSSDKMRELCDEDRTILLVTHALGTVKKMCDRAIWIHRGEVVMKDRATNVVRDYKKFLRLAEDDEVEF